MAYPVDLRSALAGQLTVPVMAAPMFRASTPDLVIAQSRAGIIGSMPSRSVRRAEDLKGELRRISTALMRSDGSVAPFAVNLVVHSSNPRFEHDFGVCIEERVPIIITSLGAAREVVDRVHAYGGYVVHDVTNMKHARKALAAGVDGLVAVCAGAGGHTGATSPFALIREMRREYDGMIIAAGAIADGHAIMSAIALGADLAYMGTRFIASTESGVEQPYRDMIVQSGSADVVTSAWLSGIPANFLAHSFAAAGLDIANLPPRGDGVSMDSSKMGWAQIWGAGHGAGVIDDVASVDRLVARFREEFESARARVTGFSLADYRDSGR